MAMTNTCSWRIYREEWDCCGGSFLPWPKHHKKAIIPINALLALHGPLHSEFGMKKILSQIKLKIRTLPLDRGKVTRSLHTPVLADAANILDGQMRSHLNHMSQVLGGCGNDLDHKFVVRLSSNPRSKVGTKSKASKANNPAPRPAPRYDERQTTALLALTPVSAIRFWLKDGTLTGFFEQVAYSGRRLAKLNLAPGSIVEALAVYDVLLEAVFAKITPAEAANFRWVREQLQFCVMLTLNNAYYQVREAESQAFYELFRDEVASRGLNDLYGQFLGTLMRFSKAGDARFLSFDSRANVWKAIEFAGKPAAIPASVTGATWGGAPDTKSLRQWLSKPRCQAITGLPPAIAWSKPAAFAKNSPAQKDSSKRASTTKAFSWVWTMPLIHEGVLTGAFQFAFEKPYEWLPREQELLAAAAERCVEAAAKARLLEDLRAREEQIRHLAEHMLQVEEMERRRISGELHDEAGQSMLYVRLQMEMIENAMPAELSGLRQKVKQTREATERTIIEIRRLIAALSPATLEQLGLGPALRHLVTRFKQWYPAKVKLQLSNLDGLPKSTEVVVYRLVQECFNNISKHSFATSVNISAQTSDGFLRLTVDDNGIGFDVEQAGLKRESFGLQGMRERVELLGGLCEIRSKKKASLKRSKKEVVQACELTSIPATEGYKAVKASQGARLTRGGRQDRIRATRPGTQIWIQLPISREAVAA